MEFEREDEKVGDGMVVYLFMWLVGGFEYEGV